MSADFPRCCAACWHSAERPCPTVVSCLATGPSCHDDAACSRWREERNIRNRREAPANPVIYIGTGTCGLGAGAAKTLAAIRAWLGAHARKAEVVEVGCIGLCVEEPLVDIQLPGRPRLSFAQVTDKKVAPLLDAIFTGGNLPMVPLGQFRVRASHQNPAIQRLSAEFLGKPLSHKSHEVLHTHYERRQPVM